MKTLLKNIAIGLSLIAGSQGMDEPEPNLLKDSPKEIQTLIYEKTAAACFNQMSYSDSLEKLYFLMKNLCYKDGKYTVNGNWFKNAILSGYDVCENDYENCLIFLNGNLKYTPDKGEPIILPIANLKNPFLGEFELSKCGDANQYLSINTGFCQGKITENSDKIEICFTPWFSVDKNLNSTAPYLEPIFTNWDNAIAQIGIFWNWGKWDDLGWDDYVTSHDLNSISYYRLSTLRCDSCARGGFVTVITKELRDLEVCLGWMWLQKFQVYFEKKLS